MDEVETKDVGTTDLSAYMMKVIEELRRDRKPPAVHIILVRSALSSVFPTMERRSAPCRCRKSSHPVA